MRLLLLKIGRDHVDPDDADQQHHDSGKEADREDRQHDCAEGQEANQLRRTVYEATATHRRHSDESGNQRRQEKRSRYGESPVGDELFHGIPFHCVSRWAHERTQLPFATLTNDADCNYTQRAIQTR
jgi:hypothetical protein